MQQGRKHLAQKSNGTSQRWRADTESKPWTTRSLVLDDAKSQTTQSLTQAVIFPCSVPRELWYSGTLGHKLTAGVHGSVPKLLTVSDAVRSHARCMYRPPGMSWTPNGTSHRARSRRELGEVASNQVDPTTRALSRRVLFSSNRTGKRHFA